MRLISWGREPRRQWRRRRGPRQRGQGLVEFAIIAVFLFPVAIGFFDLGRAVYTNNSLASAARQGARYASVHCAYQIGPAYTTTDITNWIQKQGWTLDPNKLQVSVTPGAGTQCAQPGTPVTVTLRYLYVPVTPGVSKLAGSGVSLTGSATINSQ